MIVYVSGPSNKTSISTGFIPKIWHHLEIWFQGLDQTQCQLSRCFSRKSSRSCQKCSRPMMDMNICHTSGMIFSHAYRHRVWSRLWNYVVRQHHISGINPVEILVFLALAQEMLMVTEITLLDIGTNSVKMRIMHRHLPSIYHESLTCHQGKCWQHLLDSPPFRVPRHIYTFKSIKNVLCRL